EISVHAMAGTQGPKTMKMPVWVRDRRVIVLIDNGSSHNFITSSLSDKLNLHVTKVEPFEVRVANGERLKCSEFYRGVPIKMQGVTLKADLYALPLVGPDVVLGVQWLEELDSGSFCWSQTAILTQSMKVEAIQWTGSGDGIISGGIEVAMWRRKEKIWEIAWSFKPEVPQTVVSTTWSADGFSATAPSSKVPIEGLSSPQNDSRQCVLIFEGDEHSKYPQAELHHPMPVRMIQWRPMAGKPSQRQVRHALRPVILTCCLDGAVRLWGEIDDGRIRKSGRDSSDQKAAKLSFCVIAVIEVNRNLNSFPGSDVFVSWATEAKGVAVTDEEVCYFSCLDDLQHETAGRCEWLVGFGPDRVTTLWTVHCLDDFAPPRFPRVNLLKTWDSVSSEVEAGELSVLKVLMMRTVFGPPVCSLVQLLPCNTFVWTQLYPQPSSSTEVESTNDSHTEKPSVACAKEILKVAGHSGKILQLTIHPFSIEVELAASLDENGLLLFWSSPIFFNSHIGLPTSTSSWKICGRTSFADHSPNYVCLSWAPAVLSEDLVLLMGHADGIDFFIVTLKGNEGIVGFHKLFSLPFRTRHRGGGLSRLCSIALPFYCNGNFVFSRFLLVALWMDGFQALSWEITIHCRDSQGICQKEHLETFVSSFSGKSYSISVDACSSLIPVPHNDDKVTSYDVVCPNFLVSSVEQKLSFADGIGECCYGYHMITGCIDGNLKLWRSMPAESLSSAAYWSLVGVLSTNQAPILAVGATACGQKVATASKTNQQNNSCAILIWEGMHIQSSSCFMLEDELYVEGEVDALNWLRLGNGHLLLGVCLRNELRVYVLRCHGGQDILKCEKHLEGHAWVCIAVTSALPVISDFLWGPKGTLIVIHNTYFSLFSHFLLSSEHGCSKSHVRLSNFIHYSKHPVEIIGGEYQSQLPGKISTKDDSKSIANSERCHWIHNSSTGICFCSMSEIAEYIGGPLPLFHPEALLINLSSGSWKRALIALRHLAKHLSSIKLSKHRIGARTSSNIISPVPLSNYMEGLLSPISSEKSFQWSGPLFESGFSHFASVGGHDSPSSAPILSSSKSEFYDFVEAFESLYGNAQITEVEKMQALALIDLLQEVANPHRASAYESLDEPGKRFWVAIRFQQLHFAKRFSRLPQVEELVASSGLIGWAYHSDCHDNLFNSLLSVEPSWEEMRSMGVGFWYTNVVQIRVKMERLARQRYMKNKDPKACTLLYIALNRLQVLASLFKISKDEKDKPLAGFLTRNFQEDKNKAAALKNAYVLMGKHQLELAIAFFLLGGDASSAVTVCAKNLGDEQLALVICRLIEGCGGPLERDLISKFLLPSSLSRGDFWMASFLQWLLGNYSQSFMTMVGVEMSSEVNISVISLSHPSFLDPSIGQYCLMLATKTSMKNAVGEFNAAVLRRWAALMNVTSLRRCGLPLDALECIALSNDLSSGPTNGSVMSSSTYSLRVEMVEQSVNKCSTNWISDEISCDIVSHSKLQMAMQYIWNLLKQHPSCLGNDSSCFGGCLNYEADSQEFEKSLTEFYGKLAAAISYFKQKFLLVPCHLFSMIVLSLHQNGLECIGKYVLRDCIQEFQSEDRGNKPDNLFFCPSNLLLKATEEISCVYLNYVVVSCEKLWLTNHLTRNGLTGDGRFCWLAAWGFSNQGIARAFWCLRAMLQLSLRSYSSESLKLLFRILLLFEYHVIFASAWLQKNFKAVIISVRPVLLTLMRGSSTFEIKMEDLAKLITEIEKMLAHELQSVDSVRHGVINGQKQEQSEAFPDDRIWLVSGSLWMQMSKFLEHQLNILSELNKSYTSSSFPLLELKDSNVQHEIGLISSMSVELMKLACAEISRNCSKQFATYLLQEVNQFKISNLFDLEGGLPQQGAEDSNKIECMKFENGDQLFNFEQLWHVCTELRIINGAFVREYRKWLLHYKQKSSSGWTDAYVGITREFDCEETWDEEDRFGSPSHASGSPLACLTPDDHPFKGYGVNDSNESKRFIPFQNPKEIYKRNGELLESLCVNSIGQCQAALASNKKGLIFFNWDDGLNQDESKYIWGEADWPRNEWPDFYSTSVPAYVSPGIDLRDKNRTNIGFSGATSCEGALAGPGRDSSTGGFGGPGYAGVGSSSLGRGIQESSDELFDPPATVENVRTRAFASHPSRPFFLVGSSNAHTYLWEFGKDTASATYGVLPTSNVSSPYVVPSVSAVQFEHCGHRFVTGTLNGTVSTWQLEVGGRSNIHPTESAACFNNHTADVTYVTASGSIVAAAGHSSSGVNVVVWDTLAPPATSRASIMCHEGGARSLSVFDNDIGSGSISPLILTGGKSGDVGLHDFRYIATGRTKKHKHVETGDHSINASSSVDMRSKTGDQNRNGMLWYIPKAHSGSVTKISTIPNTSFFLTGSKDGDVKLWDAKRAKLVFHWPRLHERHTFLQPSSRGFGGVVRAGVTDIQVVTHGFLTCGGDGSVKFVGFPEGPLLTTA
ncbi:transducin family protein / WD-40 repeat family protein, partial [Striga hermonthica]